MQFRFAFQLLIISPVAATASAADTQVGQEKAIPQHLADGDEYVISVPDLVQFGKELFSANWTIQEGAFRPQTKGNGAPLSDPSQPLVFPRNMNRISAPDANSCAACHNVPFTGGGGDFVANVFVLAQRFDFVTFDGLDEMVTKGTMDESGAKTTQQSVANQRNSLGMFGSGYIEMLARQMTAELQAQRDSLAAGSGIGLVATGVSFGTLARLEDGTWDVSGVEGLPPPSVKSTGAANPPSLIVMPFHQAGAVISLRQFTNNAMNHHHGIQPTERFGLGADPDQDGFIDEMTRADVTATSVYQATLAVPGRVIPRDETIEEAIRLGEDTFVAIGCTDCHVPALPLADQGWVFTEPSPYNPPGNLQLAHVTAPLEIDLNSKKLPLPRLSVDKQTGVTWVPAFTDLKLHDITTGLNDPNCEPLTMQHPAGSAGFFQDNQRFLTRKLWGAANEPPYFHHGLYTTLREAIEAHAGEATEQRSAWGALSDAERDGVIEFLKSLRVLEPGTKQLVVDENGKKRKWRDFPYDGSVHLP